MNPKDLFQGESPNIIEEVYKIVLEPERWLDTPNGSIGGRTPRDLIGTDDEYLLRDLTRRVKHGIFS